MGKASRFLLGTLKVGLGISIACLLLGLAAIGYYQWQQRLESDATRPLGTKKEWPELPFIADAKIHLATAWRDGMVYYQLDVRDYSTAAIDITAPAALILQFTDADGFKLFDQEVPLAAMTRSLGTDGEPIGFSWIDNNFQSADGYRRSHNVQVLWRGFAKRRSKVVRSEPPERVVLSRPSQQAQPGLPSPPKDLPNRNMWRQLTTEMTEAQVQELLGEGKYFRSTTRESATGVTALYRGAWMDGNRVRRSRGQRVEGQAPCTRYDATRGEAAQGRCRRVLASRQAGAQPQTPDHVGR